jgi:hypothetical protein
MCNVENNKLFISRSLEIAKEIFGVNTLSAYFKKLDQFINLIKMPKRYTDFNVVKQVTKEDLDFLNKHFNGVVKGRQAMAKYVFSHIKL